MLEPNGRYLAPAEMPTGQQPAVTRHDVQLAVDEQRHVEAEALDAARDLLDLRAAVQAWVVRIELEVFDGFAGDGKPRQRSFAGLVKGRVHAIAPARSSGQSGASTG